jgi:hypothetical protein
VRLTLLLIPALICGADLKSALTFRATFDGGLDAAVARGDKAIYSAKSYREQAAAQKGLGSAPVELAKGAGRSGDALRFTRKNEAAVFYKADQNVAFDPKNWTGTISFWLSLDPETDLAPGYCDPIQVTDKAYNDSAIWVDFTKDDKPRHFRLGVFGDLKAWNPKNLEPDKNPNFANRLVVVQQTPFARGKWTHVAIVHTGLGGGQGSATLYLDGRTQGTTPVIAEPFAWNPTLAAIRLGVNYVGLMDDVAIFNRALTADEILEIAAGRF